MKRNLVSIRFLFCSTIKGVTILQTHSNEGEILLMDRHIFQERKRPYLMAHRGNKSIFPENTLLSFKQAITDGADILETDLHLSKDNQFICIHDETIDRTTNGKGRVDQYTLAELKKYNAAKSYPTLGFQPIPTLQELVEILPPSMLLALELKTDRFLEKDVCENMISILEQADLLDRTLIISFNMRRILTVRETNPQIPIGLISMNRLFPPKEPDFFGVFFPMMFLNPFIVSMTHKLGKYFCPLDPKPDKRLWFYKLLKCDAVLSDNPGTTKQRLNRADQ